MIADFREYLSELIRDGYTVRHDGYGSDPDLIEPRGNPVETWREDYPYDARMERERYEERRRWAREARRDYEETLEAVEVPPLVSDALARSLTRWNAAFTNALRLWDQSHDWRLYRL